jgi:DNA-binding NtrC family response regulator
MVAARRTVLQLEALVGVSSVMADLRDRIRRIARTPLNVLILGETGTGKELCARAIVAMGAGGPMVALNCGSLPAHLVESEAFGHEKGAFTGASSAREGLIAAADGGTLFLDEMGEAPVPFQVALLRTLDEGEYRRVGSTRTRCSRFRLIAATNADVDELVADGRMRPDFLHRLGTVRITMPSLRDRPEDIPVLVNHFLERLRGEGHRATDRFSPSAIRYLMSREWPGNVRELRHLVEAAAMLCECPDEVSAQDLRELVIAEPQQNLLTLAEGAAEGERRAILSALAEAGGEVDRAADILQVGRATLYRRLAEYFPPSDPDRVVAEAGQQVSEPRPGPDASAPTGKRGISPRWSDQSSYA